MWLLENHEFFGRRLWLRPGKSYLFGRTASEPGQLAISHNTISRKHLTITVEDVAHGQAYNPSSRSKVVIEDLGTKTGTLVNEQRVKGDKHVVETPQVDIMMGKCPAKFRLIWHPVVLSFSFTSKELQTDPLKSLRRRFEHLDIKLLTDYNAAHTTHVVSKKRNTAKGLQALIHGMNIVTETFLNAVVEAAEVPEGAESGEPCALENDFDKYWPNAMHHLPPRGGEPVEHPDEIYAPDPGRVSVFEGYTFIFYDDGQYKNLMAPITNGGGKALFEPVTPNDTEVDDFVRHVKTVAGEKGLGSFDDGSEGRGVVLVRYLPAKGTHVDWYTEFITSVSLRLDHRPIEQSEFLEAILIKDASILRRPLEVESSPPEAHQSTPAEDPTHSVSQPAIEESQPEPVTRARTRPARGRRPVQRRFAGFDDDDDDMDIDEAPAHTKTEETRNAVAEEEGGLFVSQEPDVYESPVEDAPPPRQSQRKRKASPLSHDDLMEGMAPAVDRFKRQRQESGRTFASPTPEPAPVEVAKPRAPAKKKIKKEMDVLAMAAQHREEEEARARAEREDLARLPDDVDLSEIRRLNIVEEMPVRMPSAGRTREQDIADGRWNPKWNGMKNFKKFQRRGEATGRPLARTIVPLVQAKHKEFGIGDDYWLDDEGSQAKKKGVSQVSVQESEPQPSVPASKSSRRAIISDSSDEEPSNVDLSAASSSRAPASASQSVPPPSQRSTRSQGTALTSSTSTRKSSAKRPAESATTQPAKRSRPAPRRAVETVDGDESEDELKFRFGKRG
ncbi:hypothetical protein B0I35DRAFT_274119 [Stachybotrys elegans]|uniref:FHA domain-containing protein n=1 Tax=Stachybotrys elegans TaxID=80388 RepID=A0A8K0SIS4_9HYPO|nr:hypothetical protein B0I35DRAFT_274119 [Stachybotrys elegans]